MEAVEHACAPGEVMAYLDGELAPERAEVVRLHLTRCADCQRLRSELQDVSHALRRWEVAAAGAGLTPPAAPVSRPAWSDRLRVFAGVPRLRQAAVAIGAAAVLTLAVALLPWGAARKAPASRVTASAPSPAEGFADARTASQPTAVRLGGAPPAAQQAPEGPQIIRTIDLSILAGDFAAVKPTIERVLRDVSGFVGQMQVSETPGRSVRATLRVPVARLEEALGALRALGRVMNETQVGEDVADRVRDVHALLANARNTEQRLNTILSTRTGNVASILEVEREIARVRGEIERLEAERANLAGRVAYATVTLLVTEESKASPSGQFPLRLRIRDAFVEGVRDAADSGVEAVLWVLRTGPSLLLWGTLVWVVVWLLLRYRRIRPGTAR